MPGASTRATGFNAVLGLAHRAAAGSYPGPDQDPLLGVLQRAAEILDHSGAVLRSDPTGPAGLGELLSGAAPLVVHGQADRLRQAIRSAGDRRSEGGRLEAAIRVSAPDAISPGDVERWYLARHGSLDHDLPVEIALVMTRSGRKTVQAMSEVSRDLSLIALIQGDLGRWRALETPAPAPDPLPRRPSLATALGLSRLSPHRRTLLARCLAAPEFLPFHQLTAQRLLVEAGILEALRQRVQALTRQATDRLREVSGNPHLARLLVSVAR